MQQAAAEGQVDACVLLLQRGAAPDGRDARGRTALMVALERGQSECAVALVPRACAAEADLELSCDLGYVETAVYL